MANPTLMQKKNGKYLWFALLGLGFHPETAASSIAGKTNTNVKHIILGLNMFDKPNKNAFHIVTHFLLEKLNPTRFNEAYRYCWPVLDHKADAGFRKVTCAWVREIMDETSNSGSKVVASLFLSPGGPKFISLMLNLANHVMLQEMKTFTTDGSWVPEAAAMPTSSLEMAAKRLNMVTTRFLNAAVDQDRFLHEYQRRAQLLVKSTRELRAEGAKYDELLKRHSSDSTPEGPPPAEKVKKVRSLWSAIDGMLSAIKEKQQAVESVLKGEVDQYSLDGTDRVLKIPPSLQERVERLPHQLSSGNVYEAGQLNLLCVLELMNHALQLLKEERCLVSHAPKPQLHPQHLQEKCQHMARVLQNLHLISQRISKEGIPEVRSSIRELEAEWDRKWMDTLKGTPLVSFLSEDPALCFLSPMAPLSFEPAPEANYRSSVFSQYPATLLDKKPAESEPREDGREDFLHLSYCNPESSPPAAVEETESPVVTTKASSQGNASLEWLFDTSPPPSPRAPPPPQPTIMASVRKIAHVKPKDSPIRTKTHIFDMECDNLANQFADAVTTTSPTEGRVKGLNLEGLLSTLHGDPFSTRKQLPLMDVKSSWRKALQEGEAAKSRLAFTVDDSVWGRLTPLDESQSPVAPSFCSATPTVSQQAVFLRSPLWDTINTEALDSPSGTGSSAVHFSLDNETLPEMPSCDSLLSLDDDEVVVEIKSDDDLLIPCLKTEMMQSPQALHWSLGQMQQPCDLGSFVESTKRTPECLLSDHTGSGSGRDWLTEPATSMAATDKVFSLDLDTLETQSPPKKQEYSLPKLITFSPIDDMKC